MSNATPTTTPDDTNVANEIAALPLDMIHDVLKAHGVRHASLFGSFARGEQRSESDVDLLVDLPPGASLFDVSRLGLALEDALGRSVDLVTALELLHPVIQAQILRDQIILL